MRRNSVYSYETVSTREALHGAALTLPDGFIKSEIQNNTLGAMQSYFNEQAAGWYQYYASDIRKRHGLDKGSLKLINTCYTSKTWGAAVFIKPSTQNPDYIYAKLHRINENEDIYGWEKHDIVSAMSGPSTVEMTNNRALYESQCFAIQVVAIKVRKPSFSEITPVFTSSVRSFIGSIRRSTSTLKSIPSFWTSRHRLNHI